MATPAQIEEQVNFERDAIRCGVEKLRKNTQSLEDLENSMLVPLLMALLVWTFCYHV